MPYRNTIEALYANINDIEQMISRFGAEQSIPKIEIDIALEKMRQAYDMLLALRTEEAMPSIKQPTYKQASVVKETPEPIMVEHRTEEEIIAQKPDELQVNDAIEFEVEPEATIEQPASLMAKSEIQQPPAQAAPKTDTAPSATIQNTGTLSDKFINGSGTLNQQLTGKKQITDLASKLNLKPLANIPSAIGINEKFEFINTLFKGNKALYDSTLQRLDTAESFNDAMNIIDNEFDWDMESPLVQRLIELTHRRLNLK